MQSITKFVVMSSLCLPLPLEDQNTSLVSHYIHQTISYTSFITLMHELMQGIARVFIIAVSRFECIVMGNICLIQYIFYGLATAIQV